MPTVRDLYGFKLRCFLGSMLRQRAYLVAFGLLALLFALSAFSAGYSFPDMPLAASDGLGETASLVASLFLVFFLMNAFSGGFLLHPAEIDFTAIAPVSLRRFAFADLLLQGTVYGLGLPLAAAAVAGYALRTGTPAWSVLVALGAIAGLGLTAVLAVQALGIARSLRRRWAVPAILALMAALLAPAVLAFGLRLPVAYASLPLPTSAAIQTALLPFGQGEPWGPPVLLLFVAAAFVAQAAMTARANVPNLRATAAFMAVFDPAMSKQLQAQAMLRAFGRFRRTEGARLHRPSLVGTMVALHLVRTTRDGTLFMVVALSAVWGVLLFSTAAGVQIGGIYIAVLIPVMAVGQWMQTDRANQWIVRTTGQRPQAFYQGWWLALAGIVGAIGAVVSVLASLAAGALDLVGPLAIVGGSFGGAALTVIAGARFPYVPSELTVRPLLHMILAGVGAGLGTVPVLLAAFAAALVLPIAAPFAALAMLVPLGLLCYGLVGAGSARPEL